MFKDFRKGNIIKYNTLIIIGKISGDTDNKKP